MDMVVMIPIVITIQVLRSKLRLKRVVPLLNVLMNRDREWGCPTVGGVQD